MVAAHHLADAQPTGYLYVRFVARPSWLRRWDLVLVVVLLAWGQFEVWAPGSADVSIVGSTPINAAGHALAAGALLWRRVAPVRSALGVAVALAGMSLLAGGSETLTSFGALCIAAYSAARYAPLGRALAMVGPIAAAIAIHDLRDPDVMSPNDVAVFWIILASMWPLGFALRRRHAREAVLDARTVELEAQRVQAAEKAASDERARIARELHDVIAHDVSVIVMQAEAAEANLQRDPERVRTALGHIQRSGRDALSDLRRLLGVLRQDGPSVLTPAPTLDQVPDLVEEVRRAGLAVDLSVHRNEQQVPAGVQLSAYRILQEALTNTLRHAGAARAVVHVSCEPDAVLVQVDDDGRGQIAAQSGGHGLIGMRERVAAHGGQLDVGPAPGGGFRVLARLPLEGSSP